MIPTVAAAQLALQPYLLWIKIAVYALIVAAIFGAGAKVGYGIAQARSDAREAKQARDYQSALAHAREAERASNAASQEASRVYQSKIAALEADARRRPVPAVRVCVSAPAAGRVPAAGTAPGRPDAAAPDGLPGRVGPDPAVSRDIGPDLYRLADDADRCAAQLTALQGWARGRE